MYIIRRKIEMDKEMSFLNNWYFFIIEFLMREFLLLRINLCI